MTLYHADIRLPDRFVMPSRVVRIAWTSHAEHARLDDRYGVIPRFDNLDLSKFRPIEVEVSDVTGNWTKIVCRARFDADTDVIFALIPGRVWKVKTVWLNRKDDNHKTLDRSRYAK